jgi:hypothetical protein
MATLAFFIAVGGASAFAATQLAKNSVGAKQLKKNAVTTAKVKNGSLRAADIGGSVESALSAANANDSANLGGSPASAYKDGCPTGTKLVGGSLCVSGAAKAEGTWLAGIFACAELGLRFPSPGDALIVGSSAGDEGFWTDDYFQNSGIEEAVFYEPKDRDLLVTEITSTDAIVCVTTPTNS